MMLLSLTLRRFLLTQIQHNVVNYRSARTGIRTPVIGLEGRDDIQTTLYGHFHRVRISPISITVVLHIYDNEVVCEL